MLPSRWSGSTKWSHEYRSPLCSRATASRRSRAKMHSAGGSRTHEARAASKCWTKTVPTSRTDPLVEHGARNVPQAIGVDRAVGDRVTLLEAGVVVALDDGDELDERGRRGRRGSSGRHRAGGPGWRR